MRIELKNKSAIVEIETKGASVTSYMDALGTQYLAPDAFQGADAANILFPVAGKLNGDTAPMGDSLLEIPENGFVRDREFKVAFRSEDKLILSLNSMGQEPGYPFEFSLQVTYFINGCTLEIHCALFNPGEVPLPYGLGIQLPLLCPLPDNGRLEDHYLSFEQPETLAIPAYHPLEKKYSDDRTALFMQEQKKRIDRAWFESESVLLEGIQSGRFEFATLLTGRGMRVSRSGLPVVGLSVPGAQPVLKVAAMTGSVGLPAAQPDFSAQNGICLLPPDEKHSLQLCFCPL